MTRVVESAIGATSHPAAPAPAAPVGPGPAYPSHGGAPPRTVAIEQVGDVAALLGSGEPVQPATEVTLGRDPTCTIVIDNSVVSARHARIARVHPAGLVIDDLGSTNGTYVGPRKMLVAMGRMIKDSELAAAA